MIRLLVGPPTAPVLEPADLTSTRLSGQAQRVLASILGQDHRPPSAVRAAPPVWEGEANLLLYDRLFTDLGNNALDLWLMEDRTLEM